MEQQALTGAEEASEAKTRPVRVPLRELEDGQQVKAAFAVRERDLRRKRNGDAWLRLLLADSSGSAEAVSWDDAETRYAFSAPGSAVFITGIYETSERWGSKIKLTDIRPAEPHEYQAGELAPESDVSLERLENDLRELLATVQSAQLRCLLDSFFGEDSPTWARFRDAPAAKVYHQAYRRGLLEHTLSVAQAVSAATNFFPGIDRDVAITGALLHDIGKTEAYNDDLLAIDLTDAGRLQGEIPLGYYLVRRRIEDIPGFDPGLAQAVLHIILSHHGSLEHGSPVIPATREAVLVHMIDNLGGRLGSFDRLERELPAGESWSGFDRALSGSAYFGSRRAGEAMIALANGKHAAGDAPAVSGASAGEAAVNGMAANGAPANGAAAETAASLAVAQAELLATKSGGNEDQTALSLNLAPPSSATGSADEGAAAGAPANGAAESGKQLQGDGAGASAGTLPSQEAPAGDAAAERRRAA